MEKFPINRGMADGHLGKCFECWALFTGSRNTDSLKKLEKKRKADEERYSMSECERRHRRRMANLIRYNKRKEKTAKTKKK